MPQPHPFRGNTYRTLAQADQWAALHTEPALEPDLPIVDAHHHLWDDARGRYLLDDMRNDVHGGHNIIATVYIESSAMYRKEGPSAMMPVGEVEFARGIAARSEDARQGQTRFCAGIVGYADLTSGDPVRPVLEALIEAGQGRLSGIRNSACWDIGDAARFARHQVPRHRLLDPDFRMGFAHLAPLGLSFDAWVFHPQLPELADLARQFPATSIVLDHAGGLLRIAPHDQDLDETFRTWRGHLRQLAQLPNVTVKLGGFGMLYGNLDFHLRDAPASSQELADAWRPYIETCIEAFGVHRCMVESNFPVDKQSCGYGLLWNAFKRVTQHFTQTEKDCLYRGTAQRVYRITDNGLPSQQP